jgi:hypothetical protein
MGEPDAAVVYTDDFIGTVRALTGERSYDIDRGAGVVAGKTLLVDDEPTIVLNAVALREREPSLVERLLAHEAGHVLLHRRGEAFVGKQYLADTEVGWHFLCLGGLAIEEFRIELALQELGYPVAESASAGHLDEVLRSLNLEIVTALIDPASADVAILRQSVLSTHDWCSKTLAYLAAFTPAGNTPDLSALSGLSLESWSHYLAEDWATRRQFYQAIPSARDALSGGQLDALLVKSSGIERSLLRQIGFEYEDADGGTVFRRVASDDLCEERVSRALQDEKLVR